MKNEIKTEINVLNSAIESIMQPNHDILYSPIGDSLRCAGANQTIETLKKILIDAGYKVDISKNEVKISIASLDKITSFKINNTEIYIGD